MSWNRKHNMADSKIMPWAQHSTHLLRLRSNNCNNKTVVATLLHFIQSFELHIGQVARRPIQNSLAHLKTCHPLKNREYGRKNVKGAPVYENKLIFIYCRLLEKTNGATLMFIGKLGNKFLIGQFWSCLSFSALRHGLKS